MTFARHRQSIQENVFYKSSSNRNVKRYVKFYNEWEVRSKGHMFFSHAWQLKCEGLTLSVFASLRIYSTD